jgi:iron(III) transport system substrate-binding protein
MLPGRGLAAMAAIALPLLAPAPAAADAAWDKIVQAATEEGEVFVHGGPGTVFERILTEGFKKAYPAIKLNFSGSSGRDVITRILNEREAGVFHWDVYVGGTPSILQTLKPAGAFAPLRPMLMLPEVVDDAAWFGGFDAGWMDKEKQFTFAFDLTVDPVVVVNWDHVSHDDLKTFEDLLKPQFADKIVWDDPRLPGAGVLAGQTFILTLGQDYLVKLFSQQRIAYTANRRQNAEWVVRGRYPIGIATGFDDLSQFLAQGLGQNIKGLAPLGENFADSGFGTVSVMDHMPHPNAAKVYVNWLLSKRGQEDWGKSLRNSRRLDVAPGTPEFATKPGTAYVNLQAEDQIPIRNTVADLAKQHIAGDTKR